MSEDVDFSLVREYAPILLFHPREGEYCCYPSDAEETYQTFSDDWDQFEKDLSPKKLNPKTPCYFELWKNSTLTQIRYWFWYRYNRFPRAPLGLGEHLGDWEHVEVRIYSEQDVVIWLMSNHLSARLTSIPEQYTLAEFEYEPGIFSANH
ncbi:MAG: hypothetical protein GF411_16750, partial [Candidatus Lokiarchaeota archaeon]|nr:hypothetical protein [Candidatus Lokiarchaeota archaeon]